MEMGSGSRAFIIRDYQRKERCLSWFCNKNKHIWFCVYGKESDLTVSSSQNIWGMRGACFKMMMLSSPVLGKWFQTEHRDLTLEHNRSKLCQLYYGLIAVVGSDNVVSRIAYFHQYLNLPLQDLNCVFQVHLFFPATYCFYLGCFQTS